MTPQRLQGPIYFSEEVPDLHGLRIIPLKLKLPKECLAGCSKRGNSSARPTCMRWIRSSFVSTLNWTEILGPVAPSSNTALPHSSPKRQALLESAPQRSLPVATRHKDSPGETIRGKLRSLGARVPAPFSVAAAGSNPGCTCASQPRSGSRVILEWKQFPP